MVMAIFAKPPVCSVLGNRDFCRVSIADTRRQVGPVVGHTKGLVYHRGGQFIKLLHSPSKKGGRILNGRETIVPENLATRPVLRAGPIHSLARGEL
jgi:hypothetical protein